MHLSDAFVDAIAYVVYFLKTAQKRQAPYDQVRTRITQLLAESQRKGADFAPDDYDPARCAICAWIEEAGMNSPWPERLAGTKEPLQLKFYQTTNAGELFFDRLNALGPHQNEVREVLLPMPGHGVHGALRQRGGRLPAGAAQDLEPQGPHGRLGGDPFTEERRAVPRGLSGPDPGEDP